MILIIFTLLCFMAGKMVANKCFNNETDDGPENGYQSFAKIFGNHQDNLTYERVPLWPNGRVPYVFDVDENDEPYLRRAFDHAVCEFHKHTCIRFIPRTDQTRYVRIRSDSSNGTELGMQPNVTELSIKCSDDSIYLRNQYLRELGRVLGLENEHQRPDRDQYINVHWDAIYPGFEYTFAKRNVSTYILKYGDRFTTPLGFSKCDIVKLNTLYNCTDKRRDHNDCEGDTFQQGCEDITDSCANYQKLGYCEFYPGVYKLRMCLKSCDNCDRKCEDSVAFKYMCDNVTSTSKCSNQEQYFCPKLCNVCHIVMQW